MKHISLMYIRKYMSFILNLYSFNPLFSFKVLLFFIKNFYIFKGIMFKVTSGISY